MYIDDIVMESEGEVLIALGECMIKEASMIMYGGGVQYVTEMFVMEADGNKQGLLKRFLAWLKKAGEWIKNAFSKLFGRFSKVNKYTQSVNQQAETASFKVDPSKYPHLVFDGNKITKYKIPQSLKECMTASIYGNAGDSRNNIVALFDKLDDAFTNIVTENKTQHLDEVEIYSELKPKLDDLLTRIQNINIEETSNLVETQFNFEDQYSRMSKSVFENNPSNIDIADEQKHKRSITAFQQLANNWLKVMSSINKYCNEVSNIIVNEVKAYQQELESNHEYDHDNAPNEVKDHMIRDEAERSKHQAERYELEQRNKIWEEFKEMHTNQPNSPFAMQENETPEQWKSRVAPAFEKYYKKRMIEINQKKGDLMRAFRKKNKDNS